MKFGKYIATLQDEFHSPFYMNYKQLKKLIKQGNKQLFFYSLERELEKVNEFYIQKESSFKERLTLVLNLKQGYDEYLSDLEKLSEFCQVNQMGFTKILKKWDKNQHSKTKEIYLSRKIDVQFFNHFVLKEMAEKAKSAYKLESNVVKNMKILSPDNELRECLENVEFQQILDHLLQIPIENLEILINDGRFDWNKKDEISSLACLHKYVLDGNLEACELLVKKCNVNILDYNCKSPLHYASINGHAEICKLLLRNNADSKLVDQDGNTCLDYAILNGHDSVVEMVLDGLDGIDLLKSFCLGCMHNRTKAVELMLSKNIRDLPYQGMYPIHYACKQGNVNVLKLLIKHGFDIETVDQYLNWTPLYFCASKGNLECIKLLLENGCKVDIVDENSWSPLTYCLYKGHIECAQVVEQYSRIDSTHSISNVERGLGPSQLFSIGNEDKNGTSELIEDELDEIPSLCLPPPIIPLRVYGHQFLQAKNLILITFDASFAHPFKAPMKLHSKIQMPMKLKVQIIGADSCYTLELPMKDQTTQFCPKVCQGDFGFEFSFLNLFGVTPVAKGYLMLDHTTNCNETKYVISMVDSSLNLVGELGFSVSVILPFEHPRLLIGGKIETYWKSTAMVPTNNNSKDKSVVTSTSLKEQFLELSIQSTKDGVPVVYDHQMVEFNGISLPLVGLELCQLKKIIKPVDIPVLSKSILIADVVDELKEKLITLEDILKFADLKVSFGLILMFPTPLQFKEWQLQPADANEFVNACLKIVYDNAISRQLIFSSFSKLICTLLNWKQPNYAVFYRTWLGYKPDSQSLKASIKFAKQNDLLGLVAYGVPMIARPVLITATKERGLVVVVFGIEDTNLAVKRGCHGAIKDKILSYYQEDHTLF